MWQDPIIEETRRIKDEYAKKFNYDLHAICEDLRQKQSLSGHRVVFRQPRKPVFRSTQQIKIGTSSQL
ncbi:hypothetical protein CCP3SC1AL1_860010 [Gammaproteobacteria bacterium]